MNNKNIEHSPYSIIMVKPASFGYNEETAGSNSFQTDKSVNRNDTAVYEFERLVKKIEAEHIEVKIFEDSFEPIKPDAIFPNNWFSTQPNGNVVLYPMLAKNRRQERRTDIIEYLQESFDFNEIIDITEGENQELYLEGTGSIVFDHTHKIAFANESVRTNFTLLRQLCDKIGYSTYSFKALDLNGKNIYHTNVMLSISENFVIVCLESIEEVLERKMLLKKFEMLGKEVIDISFQQMNSFCANVLEVKTKDASHLIMSTRAYDAFDYGQINTIKKYCKIIHADIPTIEQVGGGGVRCMMAGVHLSKK